jgi:hypothetical protein
MRGGEAQQLLLIRHLLELTMEGERHGVPGLLLVSDKLRGLWQEKEEQQRLEHFAYVLRGQRLSRTHHERWRSAATPP